MDLGLVSIGIIFFVIVGAITTKKCTEFLLLGSLLGSVAVFHADFLSQWVYIFLDVVYSEDAVWLTMICGMFSAFIALLRSSRGTRGFTVLIERLCNSPRKTLLTSLVLGIVIFVDEYLNILTVGACMKSVFDKNGHPREALAYMLDSTGSPVCTLLPFSTWAVFFAALFYKEASVVALGYDSAISAYIAAIPYAFYPIFTVIIIFLFAMGWMPKLGAMKKAYQRVEETGKVYSDASRKYNHSTEEDEEEPGSIYDFILPMVVLVTLAIVTGDLLFSVIISVFFCAVLYLPRKVVPMVDFLTISITGFCEMIPLVVLVLMGYVLERFFTLMGMTTFIINAISPLLIPALFPVIVFLLVAFLSFTTGSDWGMSAVCIPLVFPLAAALDANILLTMSAVMSGATFGNHACFYSDATTLASASAGVDNIEHAATQIPYVLISSFLTVIAYAIVGIIM